MQTPLVVAIPLPDRDELKVDPVGDRRGNQRATAPSAVLLKAMLKVLREANVVPRVPVGTLEVQQVDDSVVRHSPTPPRGRGLAGVAGPFPDPHAPAGRDNLGGDDPATRAVKRSGRHQ
jgi:hypothetical protein